MIRTDIAHYRLIEHDNSVLAIHLVYLNEDGKVIDYEREPVTITGKCKESLTNNLIFILNALTMPVINSSDVTPNEVLNSVQQGLDLFNKNEDD